MSSNVESNAIQGHLPIQHGYSINWNWGQFMKLKQNKGPDNIGNYVKNKEITTTY